MAAEYHEIFHPFFNGIDDKKDDKILQQSQAICENVALNKQQRFSKRTG